MDAEKKPENWNEAIRLLFEPRIHHARLMATAKLLDQNFSDSGECEQIGQLLEDYAATQLSYAIARDLERSPDDYNNLPDGSIMREDQRKKMLEFKSGAPDKDVNQELELARIEEQVIEIAKKIVPGSRELMKSIKSEMRLNLGIDTEKMGRRV